MNQSYSHALFDAAKIAFLFFVVVYPYLTREKPVKKTESRAQVSDREVDAAVWKSSAELQELLKKYKKQTTLLRPHRAKGELSTQISKMGGIPDLTNFKTYPKCDACGNDLNFVMQLLKKDFPDFYFPKGKKTFQLFRCPFPECPAAFSDTADQKMFPYYFASLDGENQVKKPKRILQNDIDQEVPECEFRPQTMNDYPNYDDFTGNDFDIVEKELGESGSEYYTENYSAKVGTKFNGYPSWTQAPNRPMCEECGKEKEFFFQLSSEDREEGVPYPPPVDKWSPHGIMIGDLGNIYFFVCKEHGEKSIEMNWDCS